MLDEPFDHLHVVAKSRRISHITLTYRRARLEKLDAMARDPKESSSIVLRALKQIADETAADIEGMLEDLMEQIADLERRVGISPRGGG